MPIEKYTNTNADIVHGGDTSARVSYILIYTVFYLSLKYALIYFNKIINKGIVSLRLNNENEYLCKSFYTVENSLNIHLKNVVKYHTRYLGS